MANSRGVPILHARAGRASGMSDAFVRAASAGYSHVITADGADLENPDCLAALIGAARRHPRSLIIGTRHSGMRSKSDRLSALLIRLECGLRVSDPSSPCRVYPVRLLETARCRFPWASFTIESLVRAGWCGCPIVGIPLETTAAPAKSDRSLVRRTAHVLRDFALHTLLLARAMSGWPHPRYEPRTKQTQPGSFLSNLRQWLSPIRAWRELRSGGANGSELAAALAVGVFIANLPAYGFQTILSLYTARRLHLHPLAVLAGSHVSTPPIGPVLIAAAIAVGHLVLHGTLPSVSFSVLRQTLGHGAIAPLLLDWTVGGLIMGAVMALVTFAIAAWSLRALEGEAERPSCPADISLLVRR